MFVAEGNRVRIRLLKLEDVYSMQKWGKHENPLFYDYNFPQLDEKEIRDWFNIKTSKKNKRCFVVLDNNDQAIGYLTIKDIKKIKKCATLGIVFDPNHVSKGYGTETIRVFLNYFFNDLNMRTMFLEVAKYNKRAIKCYEKCGFKIIDEYKEKLDTHEIDIFTIGRYKDERFFQIEKGNVYSYLYRMKKDNDSVLE